MEKTQHIEKSVITITRAFLKETGQTQAYRAVTLQASLTYDLGIGSIERSELMHRFEEFFSITLNEKFIATIDNLSAICEEITKKLHNAQPEYTPVNHIIDPPKINMDAANTLIDLLKLGKEQDPERIWLYLQTSSGKEITLTYKMLYQKSTTVATNLIQKGLQLNDSVAILLPTSCEFFYAFFGTLLAGGIPTPIQHPINNESLEEYINDETYILKQAQSRAFITDNHEKNISQLLKDFVPSLFLITSINELLIEKPVVNLITPEEKDTAIILYTAGSTKTPKGIQLSHESILNNIRLFKQTINILPSDVMINWLPLYHAISLISMCLTSLVAGIPLVLIKPDDFLKQPERWLWTIHYHRATISAATNFDYEQCIKKIRTRGLDGLDISSWRIAINTSEQATYRIMKKFTEKFKKYGFSEHSFLPIYSLTENASVLTCPDIAGKYTIDTINLSELIKDNIAQPLIDKKIQGIRYICCGKPLPQHKIRIVDQHNNLLAEREIGRIQFCGPSAMIGYYNNLNANQQALNENWWSTGDFGYLANQQLYVVGREQDLLRLNDHEHCYAKIIENITNMLPDINTNGVAAFNASNNIKHNGFILAIETSSTSDKKHKKLREIIIEKLSEYQLSPPEKIIFVKKDSLPRTLNGKIQRENCQQAYFDKTLGRKKSPSWLQITKIRTHALAKKIGAKINLCLKAIYTGYTLLIILITGPIAWMIVLSLPRKLGAKVLKTWTRLLFILMFCPIRFTNENKKTKKPSPIIYAVNHTSYFDIIALTSVLPSNIAYTGKRELTKIGFLNKLINHLGYISVDPMDFSKTQENIQEITRTIESGRSVLLFTEGTFTYATGLRPFKMGAFTVSTQTNTPLCPISIQGVRTILRSNGPLLRPGFIKIHESNLIYPQENSWQEALRLRDETYRVISKHCGEQSINLVAAGPIKKE